MELVKNIWGTSIDPGYATIVAAIIAAVVGIGIAIYNKNKKGASDSPVVVVIPKPIDPLSDLKVDAIGVKEIDKEEFNSKKYLEKLATRIELLKNPQSRFEACYKEEHND